MFLCFLVAATVWVLNALNKTYENVRISYPVAFVYNPKKLVPVMPPPKEVVINVTGKGWKLLRRSLDLRIRPARLEVKNLDRISYLTGRTLRPALNAALNGLVLNYILTDTIFFDFEPLITRKLRLKLAANERLAAPNFALSGKPEIVPASITVTGPVSLINALPNPFPVAIPDSGLKKDFSDQVPLTFISKELIKANVPEVMITATVKPLKLVALKTRISFPENVSPTRFKLQPDSALIQYWLHPDSAAIAADSFNIQASLTPGKIIDSTAALTLTKFPKGAKRVSFSPKKAAVLQR